MCIIQKFGGDVLKFAGDALLINFERTPENARLALHCALVLVAQCDNYVRVPALVIVALPPNRGYSIGSATALAIFLHSHFYSLVCFRWMVPADQVPADDMPVTLSLHAAVGGGDGVEMHVGGIGGRWEHCISGDFFLEVRFVMHAACGRLARRTSARFV